MDGTPDQPDQPTLPTLPTQTAPTLPPPVLPPTAAPANTPGAPFDHPVVSVVVPEPPKQRRTGLMVGVLVLAVAAIGVVAFLALKGDDKASAYSLAGTAAAADDIPAVSFDMTTDAMGQELVVKAQVDNASGLATIAMDLGSLLPIGDENGGTIEAIMDTKSKTIYFKSDFFVGLGLPVDTEWLKIDRESLEAAGQDTSMFDSADVGNPLDSAALFAKAEDVKDLGFDEVDGKKVKHYEVTVDTQEAMAVSPQLKEQLDALDGAFPDTIVYDVYVDEQNLIRRMTFDIDMAGEAVTTDIVLRPLTEPLQIDLPADADVTSLTDLI